MKESWKSEISTKNRKDKDPVAISLKRPPWEELIQITVNING